MSCRNSADVKPLVALRRRYNKRRGTEKITKILEFVNERFLDGEA